MAILDTIHKKKSVGITVVILIFFLWGIVSFGLTYFDPPAEYGIAINYGATDFGSDQSKTTAIKNNPIEDIKEEEVEEVEDNLNDIPKEIISEDLVTQTKEDAPVIEESEIKDKKVVPNKITSEFVKAPKKPSKNTLKAFDNLLKGETSDGEPKDQGDDLKKGVNGSQKGTLNSLKYYGNSGKGGDSNYNLSGRNALSKPIEQPNCQEEGIVVVSIDVDKNGRVINAVPGVKGTTNSASCLLKPAREAALKTTWNADPNAPSKQKGTIIYKFSLTK